MASDLGLLLPVLLLALLAAGCGCGEPAESPPAESPPASPPQTRSAEPPPAAAATGTPPPGPVRPITPGEEVTGRLAAKESHYYTLQLTAGDFVQVAARQDGVDLGLHLLGPADELLTECTRGNGRFGPEELLAVAAVTGEHRLQLSGLQGGPEPGEYRVVVMPPHPATAAERRRAEARDEAWWLMDGAIGVIRGGPRTAAAQRGAIADLERAVPLWAEGGELYQEGRSHNFLGTVHRRFDELDTAQGHYERAIELLRRTDDASTLASALHNLGQLHNGAGRYDVAIPLFEEEAALCSSRADLTGIVRSRRQLSIALLHLGRLEEAETIAEQALAGARGLGDRRMLAGALRDWAQVAQLRGDLEGALAALAEALELAVRPNERAGVLNNLGTVYQDTGDLRRARDAYRRALEAAREAGETRGEGAILFNLGWSHFDDDPAAARGYFEQALELWRGLSSRRYESEALSAIGETEVELGAPAAALPYFERALALAEELGEPDGQLRAHAGFGLAYEALGDPAAARRSGQAAVAIARRAGLPDAEADALTALARLARDQGDPAEALRLVEGAIQLTERLRTGVASPELRTSLLASKIGRYQLRVAVLMDLDAAEPGAGWAGRALSASEAARARALQELVVEGAAHIRRGVDPELLQRERQLVAEINRQQRQQAHSRGAGEEGADEVQRLLDAQADVRAEIRRASPGYAALTNPQPLALGPIQRLLDAETLLLEYFLGDDESYLWAVGRDSFASYRLPPRAEIEAAVRRVVELMQAPGRPLAPGETLVERAAALEGDRRELAAAGAALSDLLLGPAADELARSASGDGDPTGRRLAIVPDGALHFLSFGALPPPASVGGSASGAEGGEPLLLRHEVVTLPSASTLAVLRRQHADRTPPLDTVAIFADPLFSADDPRVERGGGATRGGPERGTAPPDLPPLVRLEFTRREAEAIAGLVPSDRRLVALGAAATLERALDPELSRYRFVHFASHGLLDSVHPELSAIALSQVDGAGRPVEGFLRLHEIYNLELAADLVTLSACRTALGREVQGEGLVGLTRGFMYAGAERVVASLWQVPDRASARLMESFYRGMLQDGLAPAAALRAAQLEVRRHDEWREPYYWAAYTLQGDWSSLSTEASR